MENNKLGALLSSRLDLPAKVKHHPWYRERLNSKYRRRCTDTSSWTFIKDGSDDYRDGKPPELDETIVIKRNKGMKPNLVNSALFAEQKPRQRITKSLDPYDTMYSKSVPNQRKRIQRVREVENDILKSRTSYLPERNDLSPKAIKDLQEILNLSIHETVPISDTTHHSENLDYNDLDSLSNSEGSKEDSTVDVYNNPMFTLYRTQTNKLSSSEEHVSEECQSNRKTIPDEMEHVEWVTKDFCDWVKNIGGEKNYIDEETIKELFVCAYEGDTTGSRIVQTMNLSKIPTELLANADISRYTCIKRNIASRGSYNGNKMKYGAWYLHPKTWKARPASELLQDEKKLDENPKPQAKLDQLLPSLQSAQMFLTFTEEKKFIRKPELLRNMVTIANDDNEQIETTHFPSIVG